MATAILHQKTNEINNDCAMRNDILLEEYKSVVAAFCYFLAQLNRLKSRFANMTEIDTEVLTFVTDNIRKYKDELLSTKKELGLPGELSFLEDNCFDGFEIKNGCFIGSVSTIEAITRPWYDGMVSRDSNCYLFEVANYINFLAYPDCLDSEPFLAEKLKLVEVCVEEKESFFSRLKKGGKELCRKTRVFSTKFSWLAPVEPADIS